MPGVVPTAREQDAVAHIPGAVFFDIDEVAEPGTALPHMLPSAERFAECVSAMGIGNDSFVVVYDAAGLFSAARVWWMFRAYGHARVAILDGGFRKWKSEGRPVTATVAERPRARFEARLDTSRVRDTAQLIANLDSRREQVIDARAANRFEGGVPEPRPGLRSGHVPGSVNLSFDRMTDPASGTMLAADELARRFAEAGLVSGRPVVTSCGSGVTACALNFGLHLLGRDDSALYDGSWAEWGAPGDTPVETGPVGR
jgi:thiosulfate/3-mercaptopyruvate sulfurtransferase